MRKLTLWILFCVLSIYFAVGWVRTNTSLFLPPILELSDCELPCWNKIKIGQTKMPEFIEIVGKLDFVDKETIRSRKFSDEFPVVVSFIIQPSKFNLSQIYGNALFRDNNLIYFNLSGNLNTKMESLVNKFGEPDFVMLTGWRGFPGNSKLFNYITFVNLQKGIGFGSTLERKGSILTKEISIDYFYLFDPGYFEELSDEGRFSNEEYSYPWNGYGNIDEKYPSK